MLEEVKGDQTGQAYSRWGLTRHLYAMFLAENEAPNKSCYTMRINFQDAIKETSEQIKIRLKDKQISKLTY